ncbi:MAG: alanine racemase [Desulfobacterales bacterium]|nr:alanine racemase [Desulfobacterales bacterium]
MDTPLVHADIDLDAIAVNIQELKKVTAPGARFMAVVKANAYGHGAVAVARQALEGGADCLGVARIQEAVALRQAGIVGMLLVLNYTPPEFTDLALENNLALTVFDLDTAQAISDIAAAAGRKITVHLKTDTGMGRLGLRPAGEDGTALDPDRVQIACRIARLPGLDLEGIFTHFASADSADTAYTEKQFGLFCDFVETLEQAGLEFRLKHTANSAAIVAHPQTHLDMVRAGIALYGLNPSPEVNLDHLGTRPVMSLGARLVHVKKVPAGFCVSYGMTYRAPAPTTIATVPIGYADGYSRLLSSRGTMLVRGQRAPIVGRVCMDLTMLDVGHIEGVQAGDEVVILGRQAGETLSADEIAGTLGTINYEVVSSITARVPRVFHSGNNVLRALQ